MISRVLQFVALLSRCSSGQGTYPSPHTCPPRPTSCWLHKQKFFVTHTHTLSLPVLSLATLPLSVSGRSLLTPSISRLTSHRCSRRCGWESPSQGYTHGINMDDSYIHGLQTRERNSRKAELYSPFYYDQEHSDDGSGSDDNAGGAAQRTGGLGLRPDGHAQGNKKGGASSGDFETLRTIGQWVCYFFLVSSTLPHNTTQHTTTQRRWSAGGRGTSTTSTASRSSRRGSSRPSLPHSRRSPSGRRRSPPNASLT